MISFTDMKAFHSGMRLDGCIDRWPGGRIVSYGFEPKDDEPWNGGKPMSEREKRLAMKAMNGERTVKKSSKKKVKVKHRKKWK